MTLRKSLLELLNLGIKTLGSLKGTCGKYVKVTKPPLMGIHVSALRPILGLLFGFISNNAIECNSYVHFECLEREHHHILIA